MRQQGTKKQEDTYTIELESDTHKTTQNRADDAYIHNIHKHTHKHTSYTHPLPKRTIFQTERTTATTNKTTICKTQNKTKTKRTS